MDVKEFLKLCDEKHYYYYPNRHDDIIDALSFAFKALQKKQTLWQKIVAWFRKLFKRKSKASRIRGLRPDYIIFDELIDKERYEKRD